MDTSFKLGGGDPMRAHGAWVYLFCSIGAGALVASDSAVEPAMLVGTAFAGMFLVASALTVGPKRKIRQLLVGTSCAIVSPPLAWFLGADPAFVGVAGLTLLPAVLAIWLVRRYGLLSTSTVIAGLAALVMAAPTAAVAAGVGLGRSAVLYSLLLTFFCWRTLRVAAPFKAGAAVVAKELKARGLRESAIAAIWSIAVVVALHLA